MSMWEKASISISVQRGLAIGSQEQLRTGGLSGCLERKRTPIEGLVEHLGRWRRHLDVAPSLDEGGFLERVPDRSTTKGLA